MIAKVNWAEDKIDPLSGVPEGCLIHVPSIGTGIKLVRAQMVLLYTIGGKSVADLRVLRPETIVQILPERSRITLIQE